MKDKYETLKRRFDKILEMYTSQRKRLKLQEKTNRELIKENEELKKELDLLKEK